MKKMIALDIDGTLYNDKKEISIKTKKMLIELQKAGHIIVLASGRPTSGLFPIAGQLEMEKHHGVLLGYNGGIAVDSATKEVIAANAIRRTEAVKLLKHLEQYPVNPIVDNGEFIYTTDAEGFAIPYESRGNNLKIKLVDNIADALDFSPAKILIAAPNEMLERYEAAMTESFRTDLSFVRSAPIYLEATPKGINKAETLKIVCERLGIARSDVIAFGDAENDIAMLKFAGIGIAMGNAGETLKAAADMVTLSNNEDGIAAALERML